MYQGFMPPFYNPYYGQMMVGTNPQGFFVRKSKSKPFYPGNSPTEGEQMKNPSSDFVEVKDTKKKDEKKEATKPKSTKNVQFREENHRFN